MNGYFKVLGALGLFLVMIPVLLGTLTVMISRRNKALSVVIGGFYAQILLGGIGVVIHELSHLPVVVDPSHATGKPKLVAPMAVAAAAAGADGLIIEVHNDPVHALCDGAQSLTPDQFRVLSGKVSKVREALQ